MSCLAREKLRKTLKKRRISINSSDRHTATQIIIEKIQSLSDQRKNLNIGCYLSYKGEVDLSLWMQQSKHKLYLPVIEDHHTMLFKAYQHGDLLTTSHIHPILEPADDKSTIQPKHLDLVLVPMLGFNKNQARLGYGGGYYDRCFEHKLKQPDTQPKLIGIAFSLQRCTFKSMPWDICMDEIITD